MTIDWIITGGASALGFAIGWTSSWAAGNDAIEQLRRQVWSKDQIIAGKDQTIREQGREIAEHRAADQRLHDQRVAASKLGGKARAAKRAQALAAFKAPSTKSGAGAAAKKKG
jgi:hypothetical protein